MQTGKNASSFLLCKCKLKVGIKKTHLNMREGIKVKSQMGKHKNASHRC